MGDFEEPNEDALPVVFEREGKVLTSSRDVATLFEKRHDNVIRDIETLIAASAGCALKFEETSEAVEMPNGGIRQSRSFTMDRDGFTLLAMGFTGSKALKFKLAYIEAFNAMENRLRGLTDPIQVLNDPQAMRGLLLTYSEKVLQLEAANAELSVKGDALDRIATADGSLCITDAAKALQMRPKDLFDYLYQHGWIYKRPNGASYLGYQSKTTSGLLEHKVTTVLRADGSEKITEQVRVTPKGLAKLAALIQPIATAA